MASRSDQIRGSGEEYSFAKTHVPLRLAQFGDTILVSRSQARRVLARVNRFQEVWLDFEGVSEIGQAFADEIFRVFVRQVRDTPISDQMYSTSFLRPY